MNSIHEPAMPTTTSPLASPRLGRSRTQSLSSDRPSVAGHSLMSPPLSVAPEAGFIAASAASQIVTNDHDTHAALWYDQHGMEPSDETAVVSPAALQLVNNFLDQLLFNILAKSRSTALSALRPAVTEVLKPKLAKDAINQADEELHEYLGGGDEDDLLQHGPDSPQDWDVELIWKRTRLRCMVYSSLGDMEEEDEDYYMEQEGLGLENDEDVISPAVAIFLTSILEYMGEQTLVVAGQGAYHRLQSRLEKEVKSGNRDPGEAAERVIVDELDMDRVALDRTLGRLWRAWKKRIRSPTFDSRPYSRSSGRSSHFRQNSAMAPDCPLPETPTVDEVAPGADEEATEPLPDELTMASAIPLPMRDRDIDEIEVPGLVAYSDDEGGKEDDDEQPVSKRPHSMLLTLPSTVLSSPASNTLIRKRSNSAPNLSIAAFALREYAPVPAEKEDADDTAEGVDAVASTERDGSEAEKFSSAPDLDVAEPEATVTDADGIVEDGVSRDEPAEVDEDEVEHFEILTTARVSISGGNSPVISDSDISRSSSRQAKRPASISSPRLIEVGPKSPVVRSSSTREAPDVASQPQAADEGRHKAQAVETIFRSPISSPVSRSPSERLQQPAKAPANKAVSEADEGPHALTNQAKSTPTSASMPASASANIPTKDHGHALPAKQSHVAAGYPNRHHGPPSPIQEHAHSGTKVTILPDSDSPGSNQTPPEPTRKQSVPNRSYPPHAQDRAARRTSTGSGSVGPGGKQDAGDNYPGALPPAAPRQIHTSGSSVSSATSRLKPVRTSEESSSTRPEDVARNFEELIQSDQTIQYTLTPESMRDFDASSVNNSGVQTKSRKSDDVKRINADRSRSSSNGASSARVAGSIEMKRTPSTTRQNGSSIHSQSPKKSTLSGPVPRAPKNGATKAPPASRSQIQARDARMVRESMSDFAEFIRATGPATVNNGPSPLRNAAPSVSSGKNSVDTRRVSTTSSRARLQARDPTVDSREDNSDLIDFIRRGPSEGPGTHRIPRTVAPFRTTMDSDQLSSAGGKAVDVTIPDYRDSRASASVTDKSPSMPSSINSNTALLKQKPSHQMMGGALDEEAPMSQRKTRRVKDPYAIDFSDEEEGDDVPPSKPPAKKEESLAEFLMNYEPPPESSPAVPGQQVPQIKKKKSSASNLFGRFRSGTTSSNQSNAASVAPTAKSAPLTNTLPRANTGGSGKGYIPIQVNMPPGYDKYGPVDPPAQPKTPSSASGIPKKRFEPREAMTSSSRSGTSDLAAFLRSSEPPPSGPVRPAYPPPIEEEAGSVSRMLGRRKKAAA